jgi:hypothetical protein
VAVMIPSPERASQNPWYSSVLPFQGKCRVARQTQGVALGYRVVALSARQDAKHGIHYKRRGTSKVVEFAHVKQTVRLTRKPYYNFTFGNGAERGEDVLQPINMLGVWFNII